ncbi:MAG: phage portal protein [Bacteroides sp.]|nr:phage portal protein [Eubacterium sp.]MCM1419296.1 phage portal protein [Roseburia sp.]MCM1463416.1 phage portal protein [Bacteroides sp.]
MGIAEFFERVFGKSKTVKLSEVDLSAEDEENAVALDAFALFAAVEFAASLMANVEYKTYYAGKEQRGREWARLNFRPNRNQTAGEFWREFYSKLFYEGRALVVENGEDLIIADGFSYEERAVADSFFTDVRRGDYEFYRTFGITDVIYLEYKNETVRQIKSGAFAKLNTLYGEIIRKNGREGVKGILNVPAQARGRSDFEKLYKELMENRFKSFFKSENAVLPLFDNITFSKVDSSGKYGEYKRVMDLTTVYNELIAKAALALGISPALVRGEVAGIGEALDLTLTTLVDPIARIVSQALTTREFTPARIAAGDRIVADTAQIKHVDIFDSAANIDKLIASGYYSIDEVRERAGDRAIGEEWAKRHYITKNYESAANAKEKEDGETGQS